MIAALVAVRVYELYESDYACVYERQLITVFDVVLNHWHIKYITIHKKNLELFFLKEETSLFDSSSSRPIFTGLGMAQQSREVVGVLPAIWWCLVSWVKHGRIALALRKFSCTKVSTSGSCQWSRYIDFMRLVEQLQYGILPFVLHNLAYPDCTCYQWLLPLIYHVSVKTAQIHGFEWSKLRWKTHVISNHLPIFVQRS